MTADKPLSIQKTDLIYLQTAYRINHVVFGAIFSV